jgi:hypothetical protein
MPHTCPKCNTRFITTDAAEMCNHGFAHLWAEDGPRFLCEPAVMPSRVVVDRPTPWVWEMIELGLTPPPMLPNFKQRVRRLADALAPHGGLRDLAVDPTDGHLVARGNSLLFAHEAA